MKDFLPARKSFAGMTERLSNRECHNTTNTMFRTGRYQHGAGKEMSRERDTRTLRQPVSLWAANMIVTLFYRAKKTRGFCSRDVTTRLLRPTSSLAIRSYIKFRRGCQFQNRGLSQRVSTLLYVACKCQQWLTVVVEAFIISFFTDVYF